jgi:hypothetical protein
MDLISRRLSLVFRFFVLFFSVLFLFPSCSAEQQHIAGTEPNIQTAGSTDKSVSGTSGTGGTTAAPVEPLQCTPKEQKQACYCPDGTQTGTQLCDANGNLWPCEGCKDPVAPNAEGALCEELRDAKGCEAKSYVSKKLPTSILFVVDRSGSMMCNTPADGQSSEECEAQAQRLFPDKPSKWEITIQALKESFTSLEGSGALAGLMFFSNDTLCGVHSDLTQGGVPLDVIGSSQNALLFNALDNQSPAGGTPLVGATILAYAHLHEEAGGNCPDPPCGAPGNRFVVLITDGADSCPDPSFDGVPCGPNGNGISCTQYLLENEVPKAVRVNIRTFVIGAPGSELARGFLSDLAFRGGTGKNSGNCNHSDPNGATGDCHFDMTNTQNFANDLSQALDDISGTAIGCEFAVPVVVDADPEEVNVQYTLPGEVPVCIPQDESVPCDQGAKGWQFARNPDGSRNLSKVVLCGDYCAMVENNTSIQVDVILGCLTIVIV